MTPKVSIVIINYFHPEIITKCLTTLAITEGVDYEVVVVDNGSDRATRDTLRRHRKDGLITTLVETGKNNYFSVGNNIGVANANPGSEYILLLNSDVAFLRSDWLVKAVAWIEGTITHWPAVWDFHPTQPKPGPFDVMSLGWSHDANVVPGNARPEGFCLLIRRSAWIDMSPDFPWHYGLDEMIGKVGRAGGRIGLLFNYSTYFVHREGGSGSGPAAIDNKRTPDIPGWLGPIEIETLDFTLGPNEHDSYLCW